MNKSTVNLQGKIHHRPSATIIVDAGLMVFEKSNWINDFS